jgi:dTDP-4-dehydrorhamnose 3,5-epimerase
MIPDERGYFSETFREDILEKYIPVLFVQENESFSKKGTLRGLHFNSIAPQAKLTRVISGKALVCLTDLRMESPTYHKAIQLLLEPGEMLFVPKMIAHGFLALEDSIYSYKCDAYYEKKGETGISYRSFGMQEIIEKYQNEYQITSLIMSEKIKNSPYSRYAKK